MKNKIDLGILLTIATTSAGLWFYLLNYITDVSESEPANRQLVVMGFVHWALFLMAVLSIIAIYVRGLLELDLNQPFKGKISKLDTQIEKLIMGYWFPSIYFTGIFLVANIFNDNAKTLSLSFYVVLSLGFIIFITGLFFLGGKGLKLGFLVRSTIYLLITLGVFGFLYIVLMGETFSNAKVVTDKQFYSRKDIVKGTVIRTGYIFLPNVELVQFQFWDTVSNTNNYSDISINLALIDSAQFNGMSNYISVTTKSQMLGIVREKDHYLNISD